MTAQLDRGDPCLITTTRAAPAPGSAARYPWNPRHGLGLAAVLAAALLVMDVLVAESRSGLIPEPLRALLGVAGMILLPGLPLITMLRIPARALSASLVVGVSLAVNILITQAAMIAHWWNPLWTQWGLAGGALVLCLLALLFIPADSSSPSNGVLDRRSWTTRRWVHLGGLALSTAMFVYAARALDIADTGHFGVINALSPMYVVGLALLAAVLVAGLFARQIDHVVMAVGTVVLITYNSMLVATATGQTSIPTAFVHRGFIDIMVGNGRLPEQVDARFSWAGFFSAASHLVVATDIGGVDGLLVWAPLVMGALLAIPLYAIAIVITGRVRLAWTAVVLYQLFNWYQQDYFSPQSVALVFYATVLATLLWQLRNSPLPRVGPGRFAGLLQMVRRTPGRVTGFGPVRTGAIALLLVLMITANTVTHQITPILLIVALVWFSLLGATRQRTLWLAAGLIFAAWFSYGASDFWLGHLQSLFDEIGQVGNSVNRGVGDRLNGDPTYKKMQYLRMGASALFVLIAFAGWLCFRRKRAWLIGGALCGSPFLLVGLQSYGGEMLIRCFLLASPVLAPFAAMALAVACHRLRARAGHRVRLRPVAAVCAAAILLIFGLIETTNRGLNTAFEASTNQEVAVTDEFMENVPDDAEIMSWSYAPHTVGLRRTAERNGPKLGFIDTYPCLDALAQCAVDRAPDFVYITDQGKGMLQLQYGLPQSVLDREITKMIDSGDFVVMVDEPSVLILRRSDVPAIGSK